MQQKYNKKLVSTAKILRKNMSEEEYIPYGMDFCGNIP